MRISDWSSDVCSSDLLSGRRSRLWTHRWKVRKQTDRLCGARLGKETDHVYAPFSLIQPYASKSQAFLRMRCVHTLRAAVWPKTAGDNSTASNHFKGLIISGIYTKYTHQKFPMTDN